MLPHKNVNNIKYILFSHTNGNVYTHTYTLHTSHTHVTYTPNKSIFTQTYLNNSSSMKKKKFQGYILYRYP